MSEKEIVLGLKALRTITEYDLMRFVEFPELTKGGSNWSRNIIYRDDLSKKIVTINLKDIGKITLIINEMRDIVDCYYQTVRTFDCIFEFSCLDAFFTHSEYEEIVKEYLHDECMITEEKNAVKVIDAVYDRVYIDFLSEYDTVKEQALSRIEEQDDDASACIRIYAANNGEITEYTSGTGNTIIRRYKSNDAMNDVVYVFHTPHAPHNYGGGASECTCNSYFTMKILKEFREEVSSIN